ncbi:MAG: hypothetical protein WC654_07695, partial [Patescibacteria group bacterium]
MTSETSGLENFLAAMKQGHARLAEARQARNSHYFLSTLSIVLMTAIKTARGVPTITEMARETLDIYQALIEFQTDYKEMVLLAVAEVEAVWLQGFWQRSDIHVPNELADLLAQARVITAEEIVAGNRLFTTNPRNSSERLHKEFGRLDPKRFGYFDEATENRLFKEAHDLSDTYRDAFNQFDNGVGAEARSKGFSKALGRSRLPKEIVDNLRETVENQELSVRERYYTAEELTGLWLESVRKLMESVPGFQTNWIFQEKVYPWQEVTKGVREGTIDPRAIATRHNFILSTWWPRLETWRQTDPDDLDSCDRYILRHVVDNGMVFRQLYGGEEKLFGIAESLQDYKTLGFDPTKPADRVVLRRVGGQKVVPYYLYRTTRGDVAVVAHAPTQDEHLTVTRTMEAAERFLIEERSPTNPIGESGVDDR